MNPKFRFMLCFSDEEHCWKSDDQCDGGMKWTSWGYRWLHRKTFGFFPKGGFQQNTEIDCTINPDVYFLNQADCRRTVLKNRIFELCNRAYFL